LTDSVSILGKAALIKIAMAETPKQFVARMRAKEMQTGVYKLRPGRAWHTNDEMVWHKASDFSATVFFSPYSPLFTTNSLDLEAING